MKINLSYYTYCTEKYKQALQAYRKKKNEAADQAEALGC